MEFWICDVALSSRFIYQEKRIRFKKPEKKRERKAIQFMSQPELTPA